MLIVLAAGAGIGVVAWLLRRAEVVVQRPPAEVFADEVAGALRCADGKQAGAIISLALRRYSGAIYNFDGPAATVDEIVGLIADAVTAAEQAELRKVLGRWISCAGRRMS